MRTTRDTEIIRAESSHLESLTDLFEAYRAFYKKPADRVNSRSFLKQRLENEDSMIFIAIDSGILTGFVQLYPLFSSTRLSRYWLLNDLYVNPPHRGKGISRALIERAKQLCRETQACGMYLETEIVNTIGNRLYPACGFKPMDEVNFYEWSP